MGKHKQWAFKHAKAQELAKTRCPQVTSASLCFLLVAPARASPQDDVTRLPIDDCTADRSVFNCQLPARPLSAHGKLTLRSLRHRYISISPGPRPTWAAPKFGIGRKHVPDLLRLPSLISLVSLSPQSSFLDKLFSANHLKLPRSASVAPTTGTAPQRVPLCHLLHCEQPAPSLPSHKLQPVSVGPRYSPTTTISPGAVNDLPAATADE
jgi:hypothetical protein